MHLEKCSVVSRQHHSTKSHNSWQDERNRRIFFDSVGKQLGIKNQQDWYFVTLNQVQRMGGSGLLTYFNNSLFRALQNIYSEFDWKLFVSSSLPKGKNKFRKWRRHFVADSSELESKKETDRNLMNRIGKQLGIETHRDWYQVSLSEVKSLSSGVRSLLRLHRNSLFDILSQVYSEFEWNPFPFFTEKRSAKNVRLFLDWIGDQFCIENQHDWYQFTARDVKGVGASSLFANFDSLCSALQHGYPEFQWNAVLFPQITKHWWRQHINQRKFLDWIGGELGIERQEDWYNVTEQQIFSFGGYILCQRVHRGFQEALEKVYSEYQWHPWLFRNVQHGLWTDSNARKSCLEWIGHQLGVKQMHQWLSVSKSQVKEIRGGSLVYHFGDSWLRTLTSVFPQFNWPSFLLQSNSQQRVFRATKSSFISNEQLFINYKVPAMEGSRIELDLYFPSLSLALEYQGEMHHRSFSGKVTKRHLKDQQKKDFCKIHGITVIEVPYWWNHSIQSLLSSIHKVRPDIQSIYQ